MEIPFQTQNLVMNIVKFVTYMNNTAISNKLQSFLFAYIFYVSMSMFKSHDIAEVKVDIIGTS